MTGKDNEKYKTDLIEAILGLESAEEASRFFSDLCTRNEIVLLEQRFAVARMLSENKTYQEIAAETGASTATISRVSRTLNFGQSGYTSVLDKMDK